MKEFDVIIIGAGVAGSTAAFHLAKRGHSVILLEKGLETPFQPCGGGMASCVQQWFPFDLLPIVDEVINRVDFSWCLGDQVVADLPGKSPFWIVQRERLDQLITNKAIEQGVQLIRPFLVDYIEKTNTGWSVRNKEGELFSSKAIVLSNGSDSKWPKKYNLGPKNLHRASTTSVRLEGRGNMKQGTSRFEFGLVHHGFAWAFPIKDGVNIGMGTFIGRNEVNTNLVLKTLLPSLGFPPDTGTIIKKSLNVWNGHHKLDGDGIVVVGDAASLCDPFLAEGIRPSIMSGFEAAKSLNEWLRGDLENLNQYTEQMKIKWGESMAWGRRISQVFYRFPKVGYQLGIKRPTAPQRIAQILSGEMGYGEIAERVIKRLIFQR